MKLLVFVLNKVEKLDKLLNEFGNQKISGATILNSKGMAHELLSNHELGWVGSFVQLLDPHKEENKTIFMVVKEEKIPHIIEIIEDIVGSLEKPDTGILFTVPVDYVSELKKK